MDAGPWMDDVLLLTPGPTPLHPWAQAALGWPMRGHMDPDVFAHNDAIVADLRRLYAAADGAFTSLLAGSGSLGMEAGLANLCQPGERLLVATNGVFGDRMVEMGRRLGAEVHVHRVAPGEAIEPDGLREAAERVRPAVVALVHGETSTGVLNPVADLAPVVRDAGALWSVDAVTTVGMLAFEMAAWGVDYAYTGSQKCLSAPPGLAPVAVSDRAMTHVGARRTPVSTWYADLVGMQGYWSAGDGGRRYHHTVPIHLHWATGEAIRAALAEGVAARAERARRVGKAVAAALATVGFGHLVAEDVRLPTVLALTLPEGLDDTTVRAVLRAEQLVSLAGGLGSTAGRVWRLGLMGEAARPEPYRRLMAALAAVLPRFGVAAARELPAAFEAAWSDAAPRPVAAVAPAPAPGAAGASAPAAVAGEATAAAAR
jgi:alanine-glyoxylate transaminase / serine-glyoxylate transaminase / serine-pyruvate transaminase